MQVIRDVLLLGHRQAFAWVDEWIGESPQEQLFLKGQYGICHALRMSARNAESEAKIITSWLKIGPRARD